MDGSYTEQLIEITCPVYIEGIRSIWKNTIKTTKVRKLLLCNFQQQLSQVSQWSHHMIETEYARFMQRTGCNWLDNLIKAAFKECAQVLMEKVHGEKVHVTIPASSAYMHQCYLAISREMWRSPSVFYDENEPKIRSIVTQSIRKTIYDMLPLESIVTTYVMEAPKHDASSSHAPQSPMIQADAGEDEDEDEEYDTEAVEDEDEDEDEEYDTEAVEDEDEVEDEDNTEAVEDEDEDEDVDVDNTEAVEDEDEDEDVDVDNTEAVEVEDEDEDVDVDNTEAVEDAEDDVDDPICIETPVEFSGGETVAGEIPVVSTEIVSTSTVTVTDSVEVHSEIGETVGGDVTDSVEVHSEMGETVGGDISGSVVVPTSASKSTVTDSVEVHSEMGETVGGDVSGCPVVPTEMGEYVPIEGIEDEEIYKIVDDVMRAAKENTVEREVESATAATAYTGVTEPRVKTVYINSPSHSMSSSVSVNKDAIAKQLSSLYAMYRDKMR